jgi:hypothetical protein
MIQVTVVGMVAEFAGAILMVLPDIPYIKSVAFPTTLQNARRELFDTSSVTNDSDVFDVLLQLVQTKWEGELRETPWAFLIEKPEPGVAKSLFAIYDEDSNGPYSDLMDSEDPQPIPNEFEDVSEYVWESEKWDAICDKQILDEWVSEEVSQTDRRILTVRGIGFLFFILGFCGQLLIPYLAG